ncbi:MAG TPA: helix-turn-helix transcriptional regulator [Candidatus Dormibacteraeota bacterium]|nr:helix-turn-helix transcriptional regulator [Candidatus Dormibacteraeota bacterium]
MGRIQPAALDDLAVAPEVDGTVFVWHAARVSLPTHRHRELELNLVRRGTGSLLVGEKRYWLRPGVLIWLFPGQDHVLLDPSRDLELWIAVFRPELVERLAASGGRGLLDAADPPGTSSRRVDPAGEVGRRLEALFSEVAEAQGDTEMTNAGLAFLLMRAWSAFHEQGEDTFLGDVHPAVERAAMLIRDRPEVARLGDVATAAGLSAGRLSRLFRQQLGLSPMEFRDRRRVERFLELYGDGARRSVVAAAELAGFGSYAQFLRVFRAVTGNTPRAWVRRPPET